ncbi:MAG: zinc ribbon domain-containing protein [Promethearchaeota archaeon]
MTSEKEYFARKRFGELISDGFQLFIENYGKIILPFLLFGILSILIRVFALTDLNWIVRNLGNKVNKILDKEGSISDTEFNTLTQYLVLNYLTLLLDTIIDATMTVLAICSVSIFLYKKYLGKDANFSKDFKKAFNSKIFYPIIILGILTPIGFIPIIIIGIILFIFYIFAVYTYNLEEDNESPLSRSRNLMRGSSLRIIGIFILAVLVGFIADLLYSTILNLIWPLTNDTYYSWFNPDTRNYGMIILYQLVSNIPTLLLAPLFICLLTPLFTHQKVKDEMGILYMPRFPGYAPPTFDKRAPPTGIPIEHFQHVSAEPRMSEGMYCPFCGFHIISPKKFCPNCGKSLDFEE